MLAQAVMQNEIVEILGEPAGPRLAAAIRQNQQRADRVLNAIRRGLLPPNSPPGSASPRFLAAWKLISVGVLNLGLLVTRLDRRFGGSGEMAVLHGIAFPQTRGIHDRIGHALGGEASLGSDEAEATDKFRGWVGSVVAGAAENRALALALVHVAWTRIEIDALRSALTDGMQDWTDPPEAARTLPEHLNWYLRNEGLDGLRLLEIALRRHHRFETSREIPEPISQEVLSETCTSYLERRAHALVSSLS